MNQRTFDGSGGIDGGGAGEPGEGRLAAVEAEAIAAQGAVDAVVVVGAADAGLRVGHGHPAQLAKDVGQLSGTTAAARRSRRRITGSRQRLDPFQRSHRWLRHGSCATAKIQKQLIIDSPTPINQSNITVDPSFAISIFIGRALR